MWSISSRRSGFIEVRGKSQPVGGRTPRPSNQIKSGRFRRLARLVEGQEPLILLISVVVSSISTVFSAAALYFTATQVRLLDNERLTPYKVALFNQRLDGVRQSFDAIAEFENKALCYESTERMVMTGDLIKRADLDKLLSCSKAVDSAMSILNNDIRRNIIFWPKKSRYTLGSYLVKASEINTCGSITPLRNSSHMTSELSRTFMKSCTNGFDSNWNDLTKLRNELQSDAAELIDSGNFN